MNFLRAAWPTMTVSAFFMSFGSLATYAGEDRHEAIEPILKAWRERQVKAESARFAWTERRQMTRGSLMPPEGARDHGLSEPAASNGLPPKDLDVESPCGLLIKGDWMRYTTRSLRFAGDGSATLNEYVSSYDGASSRSVTWPQGAGRKDGNGSIRNERRNTDVPSQPLVPLRLYLRPLAGGFNGLQPERLKVVGVEPIGGRRCLIVEDSGGRGEPASRVWVDPGRGHTVRRWESFLADGTVLLRADITYAASESLGWVPGRWEVSVLDRSGKVIRSHNGELTEYEVGLNLRREDFRLEFPSGTHVYDHTRQEEFIVGKDGSRLPIRQPPP